jgi:hypothetical protein
MHEPKLTELLASTFAATALKYFSCSCNLKSSPTRTIHTKRATTVFVQLNDQYYVLAYGYILVIAAFKDNKVECKFSTPDKMYVKEILTTPTHPNTFVFHEGKRIYACNWQRKQLIHLKTLPIVHKVVLLGSYIIYTSGAPTTRISIREIPKLREPFTEFDNIIGTNFLVLPSGKLIVASEKNLYLYDFVECIDIYAHTERITDIALFDSSHIVIFSANKFFGINRIFNYETKNVVRAILEPKQVLTVLPKQGILRMESTNNIKWGDWDYCWNILLERKRSRGIN